MRGQQYASCDDFQQIFQEDMSGLYLLSFLLTADREKAEQCFVSGLEDAVEGNRVFKDWAGSWARRAIIQNAVRVINPRSPEASAVARDGNEAKLPAEQPVEIAAVLKLEPFERFVYVMSVLERYSDQHIVPFCWAAPAGRSRLREFGHCSKSAAPWNCATRKWRMAVQQDRPRTMTAVLYFNYQ